VPPGRQVRIGDVQHPRRGHARTKYGYLVAAQGEPVPLDHRPVGEGSSAQNGRGPEGLDGS